MENRVFEVEVCYGSEFDRQSAILFTFDNWDEAQIFIILSLKNDLIVQIESSEKTE